MEAYISAIKSIKRVLFSVEDYYDELITNINGNTSLTEKEREKRLRKLEKQKNTSMLKAGRIILEIDELINALEVDKLKAIEKEESIVKALGESNETKKILKVYADEKEKIKIRKGKIAGAILKMISKSEKVVTNVSFVKTEEGLYGVEDSNVKSIKDIFDNSDNILDTVTKYNSEEENVEIESDDDKINEINNVMKSALERDTDKERDIIIPNLEKLRYEAMERKKELSSMFENEEEKQTGFGNRM